MTPSVLVTVPLSDEARRYLEGQAGEVSSRFADASAVSDDDPWSGAA